MFTVEKVLDNLKDGILQRVLGFGSSNTEHFLSGLHWFDCIDLALRQTYGRNHRCINTGIGGHTSADLLARFEQDAAFYRPHLVFITIGGNDSNPVKNISPDEFTANLRELHRRFTALECAVVFQTYYSFDPGENPGPDMHKGFYQYMDIVRRTAEELQTPLVDHLAHWEPFREKHRDLYVPMMHDMCHVNYKGNMVMGLDIARKFGLTLGADSAEFWEEARKIQNLMDESSDNRA